MPPSGFESIDVTLSRDTYIDAMLAAMFAGRLAVGVNVVDVARAARGGTGVHPTPVDYQICCSIG